MTKYRETLHYLETRIASAWEHAKRAKERWPNFDDDNPEGDPDPTQKWLYHWQGLCHERDARVIAGAREDVHPVFQADDCFGWHRDEFESDIYACHHPVFVELVDDNGNPIPGSKQVIAMVNEFSVGLQIARMLNNDDCCPDQSTGDSQ